MNSLNTGIEVGPEVKFSESDIQLLGMVHRQIEGEQREEPCHVFGLPTQTGSQVAKLATALLSNDASFTAFVADGPIGASVFVRTDKAGLAPTAYNVRRRLVVTLNEAKRLLTESCVATSPHALRPYKTEHLPPVAPAETNAARTVISSWTTDSQGRQVVETGGYRYTFESGAERGVTFGMTSDGWHRMRHYRSTSQDGGVLVELMASLLKRNCRLHAEAHFLRFARGTVEVPSEVGLMEAIDAGNIAEGLWQAAQKRLSVALYALPWQGQDSLYEEAFNDARDDLLGRLAKGSEISGVWDGFDPTRTTVDGSPVEPAAVARVLASHRYEMEFESTNEQKGFCARLKQGTVVKEDEIHPRRQAVSFAAFEEYCEHRRHWAEDECLHPNGRRDRCGVCVCPRVDAVYRKEARDFNEDPHFNRFGDEWDTQVVPIHVNTKRSYAWKAAGEQRIAAIVGRVASAFSNVVGDYLPGLGEQAAAREAVQQGHLEVVRETPLGPIVRLAEKHRQAIMAAKAAREREAEPTAG